MSSWEVWSVVSVVWGRGKEERADRSTKKWKWGTVRRELRKTAHINKEEDDTARDEGSHCVGSALASVEASPKQQHCERNQRPFR